jgi:hypothetical protein
MGLKSVECGGTGFARPPVENMRVLGARLEEKTVEPAYAPPWVRDPRTDEMMRKVIMVVRTAVMLSRRDISI